jgi:hypothetical protein
MNATFPTLWEVEAAQTANDSGVRPIGELMPEVLARYGIGEDPRPRAAPLSLAFDDAGAFQSDALALAH